MSDTCRYSACFEYFVPRRNIAGLGELLGEIFINILFITFFVPLFLAMETVTALLKPNVPHIIV